MPKVSTSSRGKKRSKDRGGQYHNAAKVRKLRKSRFNGTVEVIEPDSEENRPFSVPILQAEVYAANPVNLNKPRVIISATAKWAIVVILVKSLYLHGNRWKQAAATDDDDDDESEDLIVVSAEFVDDVAEMLGNLSLVNSPAAHTPYPALSHQFSHTVPEPMLVELVNDNAATSPPKPSMPTPHAASIPESFPEVVWSSASRFQDSRFFQNNMNAPETSHFHQHDIQNHSYLGSIDDDDDVDMISIGDAMMEPPDCPVPMKWTSQPEHEITYGQVADSINQCQTTYYTIHNIQVNSASMVSIPSFVILLVNRIETVRQLQPMQLENESNDRNQPHLNHPINPLAATIHFQETLSRTSQPPATAPEVVNSTLSQSDEQRPDEEPGKSTKPSYPIYLPVNSQPGGRRHGPHNNLHPFPYLKGCKDMKYITMSGESEESRTIWHGPGHRRWETPPDRSEMGLGTHLVRPLFYII